MAPTAGSEPPRTYHDIPIAEVVGRLFARRRVIAGVAVASASLALVPSFFTRATYSTTATVIPSGAETGSESRLRGLTSQFGLGDLLLGGGNTAASPDFILKVAKSNVVQRRLLLDTLATPDSNGRQAVLDVLLPRPTKLESVNARELRMRKAQRKLGRWIAISKSKDLDAIDIHVATPWPLVSQEVAEHLLAELNTYMIDLGRQTAHEEHRFVQQRILEHDTELRAAEARLAAFLEANREFRISPNLVLEHDRLTRAVDLRQQVLVSLIQSSEDAQIRELRDTPTLQVLEPPLLPAERDPRGRLLTLLLGGIGGAVVASLVVLLRSPYLIA